MGYRVPPPSTARGWLERFHDEEAVARRPVEGSFLPQESAGLAGLREVVRQCVRAYVSLVETDRQVTLDVDAHKVDRRNGKRWPRMREGGTISRWWSLANRRGWSWRGRSREW